jgi:hypothetical protein
VINAIKFSIEEIEASDNILTTRGAYAHSALMLGEVAENGGRRTTRVPD